MQTYLSAEFIELLTHLNGLGAWMELSWFWVEPDVSEAVHSYIKLKMIS